MIFHDDVELVGILESEKGPRIVVSHADSQGVQPSVEDIHEFFVGEMRYKKLRVSKTLGGYDAEEFFGGRIGVFDARPANCVLTSEGVVPIDFIPQLFNRRDANVLRNLSE